jgi:hypothetical protein
MRFFRERAPDEQILTLLDNPVDLKPSTPWAIDIATRVFKMKSPVESCRDFLQLYVLVG